MKRIGNGMLTLGMILAAAGVALTTPSQAAAAEHKVLDVTREYHTGITGFSENDTFPVPGHVTRVELSYTKEGPFSGGAYEVLPRQPGQVVVHRFLDCFSTLKYHLIVYADD